MTLYTWGFCVSAWSHTCVHLLVRAVRLGRAQESEVKRHQLLVQTLSGPLFVVEILLLLLLGFLQIKSVTLPTVPVSPAVTLTGFMPPCGVLAAERSYIPELPTSCCCSMGGRLLTRLGSGLNPATVQCRAPWAQQWLGMARLGSMPPAIRLLRSIPAPPAICDPIPPKPGLKHERL